MQLCLTINAQRRRMNAPPLLSFKSFKPLGSSHRIEELSDLLLEPAALGR